jgi:pimeloyl-ACP methyl ester carboxylesterase
VTEHSAVTRTELDESSWHQFSHGAFVNGRPVWYVDAGSGPTIVLLHGAGATWRAWLANLVDLTRDHRVIAIDLPGFGDSANMPWSRDLAPYAAAVVGLLDQLDAHSPTIVGHSFGGLVAQRVASQLVARCSGLVLVGALGIGASRARRLELATSFSIVRLLIHPRAVARFLASRPAIVDPLLGAGVHNPARVPRELVVPLLSGFAAATGWWRAMLAGILDQFPQNADAPGCPTLLLWGESDRLATLAMGRALAAAIPGAELECWPGVGHNMMLEKPDEFGDRLRRFVQANAPASSTGSNTQSQRKFHRGAPR